MVVVLVVVGSAVQQAHTPREPLQKVADFHFVDQAGRPFARSDLAGRPWVANFIYTRCAGTCHPLSDGMKLLQPKLEGTGARLVSFTVDPEHDTSAVLAEYAKAHDATERWTFLTGDVVAISSLVYESFQLPILRGKEALPGDIVTHSSSMVLVDREGRIRGRYAPLDDDLHVDEKELDHLVHDLRALGTSSRLPLLNATLNATSALLLVLGYALIRAGRTRAHAAAMLSALAVSAVFLGCYLYYHLTYPATPFAGEGPARALYLAILVSHVLLAVPTVPLAVGTAILGLKGHFERHVFWARIAFSVWIYVSVTGVAVYALLYEIYRP